MLRRLIALMTGRKQPATSVSQQDTPAMPHEVAFRSNVTMTPDLPQKPLPAVQEWLASLPNGTWKYIFDMGDLWGVGFVRKEDADRFRADWEK